MKTSLILTAIGADKPGLVELLSTTLAEHRANWQQSSMSRLAGQFAGILIASVDDDKVESLLKALDGLSSQGLTVSVVTESGSTDEPKGQSLTLELIGHDKPGIVRDISRALASRKVSVEELATEVVSGSMSAELLFKAKASLIVPQGVDLDDLQDSLEAIASDLMVDITLD
ncbi:glycine cleavage system protein R [Motiliproteus sp.]|uniref:glycine cleavage system protein R n=1 Tax=Motiliproteus sp. TaxID=1898955 RepID=UPI003BA88BDD